MYYMFICLTFLVLCDDWVAKLSELSSPDLVDGLDSEVVLSVGDEVFNVPAHLVLSGHHVDVRPPASFTTLRVNNKPNDQFHFFQTQQSLSGSHVNTAQQ